MTHNASSEKLHKEDTYEFTLNPTIFHPIYTSVVKHLATQMKET